mmetsp:Transcript_41763/g.100565  ORF Transcript_41763/g.100565 Transcript_41763/m.100565 type:complete len:2052 (-) Transcript_41763:1552-7707(-)
METQTQFGVEDSAAFCSILNVVIDSGMAEPTPLEPDEYNKSLEVSNAQGKKDQQQQQHQKVPVIRIFGPVLRQHAVNPPLQSACLHIHGAYPYMIARPRVAGPDGSLRGRSKSGHIDWDDAEAVSCITDNVHKTLESTLQSYDLEKQQRNDRNPSARAAPPETSQGKIKFIRKITVVEGRGFYTYCNGPPCPFLRVEYYDPQLRWKVKMLLERGMELPRSFHPDARQYDRDDPPEDLLKFHCYEAHIPYTMQFFKDWNLAGMSYLHLRSVKIRGRPGTYSKKHYSQKAQTSSVPFNEEDVFLSSNTPSSVLWKSEYQESENDVLPKRTKKVSSCDVEMDCTVDDIMNRDAVLKTLLTEEKDEVHWRAVPSLQEIWKEERIRMRTLLGPQHDLVSKPLSFTLNVKKDALRPGARPARKGMKKLVKVTYGLEDDFKRSLTDILNRHLKAIEEVDNQRAAEREKEQSRDEPGLTPTMDDAIDALESMNEEDGEDRKESDTSPPNSQKDWLFSPSQEDLPSQDGEKTPPIWQLSQSQDEYLSYSCSQHLHEEDSPTQTLDLELYSQKIERGEAIVDDLDDAIDPETLLPYEELAFGKDTCRAIFVVESDPPGMKRVCGSRCDCSRPGHENTFHRAKPKYYKTVTTGKFVDGLLYQNDDEEIDLEKLQEDQSEDEFSEDEEDLMRDLLATQIPNDDPSGKRTVELDSYGVSMTQPQVALGQGSNTQGTSSSGFRSSVANSDGEEDDDETVQASGASDSAVPMDLSSSEGTNPLSTIQEEGSLHDPPSRGDLLETQSQGSLFPLSSRDTIPTWLQHARNYASLSDSPSLSTDIGRLSMNGQCVQPVTMPPTRGRVVSWHRKRTAKATNEEKNVKRKRTEKDLQIDSNSRKLVVMPERDDGGIEESREIVQQNVEEVVWQASQTSQLTPSQSQTMPEQESEETQINLQETPPKNTIVFSSDSVQKSTDGSSENITPDSLSNSGTQSSNDALDGIGQIGGRIHIQGGGGLKTRTRMSQPAGSESQGAKHMDGNQNAFGLPTPISFMSIEIHVQCRAGYSRLDTETKTHKKISLTSNPRRREDKISAIVFVHGRDPGGGKSLEILARGCLFVPLRARRDDTDIQLQKQRILSSMPPGNMGITSPLSVECFRDEKSMLRRFANVVRMKDPDMLLSWDPQASGLGYIIERGVNGAETLSTEGFRLETLDMARLLGRTPSDQSKAAFFGKAQQPELKSGEEKDGKAEEKKTEEKTWRGSGLGSDWDDKVGAGAAAASIIGRLVFAAYKIVAEEVKHANASYLPAVVSAVMNKRIPHHDELTLTQWYASGNERWRVLNHRLTQATSYLLLFDALDIVGRAGEAARLSGVEFSQSFPGIRGSQYKVEGVLLRALQSLRSDERGSKRGKVLENDLTTSTPGTSSASLSNDMKSPTQEPWKMRRDGPSKLENRHYFFFSSSAEDANLQEALEVQALTLEPQSGHYTDPIVVCDFTALYPSLVIAYNLCYSTIAGKLEYHSTRSEMQMEGRTKGHLGPFTYPERRTATVLADHMKSLNTESSDEVNRAYVAPTGSVYVSEDVLKGVLPLVLEEILTTRAMIKKAAKEYKKNVKDVSPAVLRQLEARQLALKYVANVTYGYTSATFSGRCAMPLLADTIVECGRKTLRRAIDLANRWGRETERWKGCRVVYGDTDSLFIVVPGRTHQEAFTFGEELCEAVRKENPPPVELKLEKVYVGSIMQTMKKYCGMKFESRSQKKPTFEAKGLETVRRDQCALTQKVLRNALIQLFNRGVAEVKEYLFRQWSLIYSGNLPVSDFILTGRVRSRYRGGREGPVQAVLANRIRSADPDFAVRSKQRLPYVIIDRGSKNYTLKDCVLTPMELMEHWNTYKIHTGYYIEKHVNASLQRCLGLAPHKIDVNSWFRQCPRPRRRIHFWPTKSFMITDWFGSGICTFCEKSCHASGRSKVGVCGDCRKDPTKTTQLALPMLQQAEQSANAIAKECQKCNGCFESAETFANERFEEEGTKKTLVYPLANCVCIDCPNTFKRHRLKELLIESTNTCEVLGLDIF